MRNTNKQANSNASNLWKQYLGGVSVVAISIAGIASAAITPIPNPLPNAVAGNVIKSSDINDLVTAVTILDRRTLGLESVDGKIGVGLTPSSDSSTLQVAGGISAEEGDVSTDRFIKVNAWNDTLNNGAGEYFGSGFGKIWYNGDGAYGTSNPESTLIASPLYSAKLSSPSLTSTAYLKIQPYGMDQARYGTGEARVWYNGIGGSIHPASGDNTIEVLDANFRIKTGQLGIGLPLNQSLNAKLDVNGSIKVANTNNACDATHAGSIKYSGGNFQGCNGTAWVQLNN